MYRALYRKYRPLDFGDVYGQPHIVRTLKNQIEQNHLSHAYLFTGSRGTGKTTCAKILAKTVNCLHPVNGEPCNECDICKAANEGTLMDVTEIDAASNNGVDSIRELRDNTAYTPAQAKYRVYIIDEVHMLSTAAFNALLKTLEEPPEHVIFILATTEVHQLPATIISRCQRFDFHRIPPEEIQKRLLFVAQKESIDLDSDAAALIARLADGAMRDALSLLDVCAAEGGKVDSARVLDTAGLSGRQYLSSLAEDILSFDCAHALETVGGLYMQSKDLAQLCRDEVSYMRDLMLIKTLRSPQQFLTATKEELEDMKAVAERFSLEKLLYIIDRFENAIMSISRGCDRKVAVERAIVELCNKNLNTSVSALLERIEALENGAVAAAVEKPAPAKKSAPANKAEPVKEQAPDKEQAQPEEEPTPQQTEKKPDSDKFDKWSDVLSELSRTDPMLRAVIEDSDAFLDGDIMRIRIKNDSFRDMVNNDARHRSNLKAAIFTVTGQSYRLGPYTEKEEPEATHDPLNDVIANASSKGLL